MSSTVKVHILGFKSQFCYFLGASQVVLVVRNMFANAGDMKDVGCIPG